MNGDKRKFLFVSITGLINPRDTNAVAKTACRLATVDQRRFHFLIQQHPQFSTHVMKELAHRLRYMTAAAAKQQETSANP